MAAITTSLFELFKIGPGPSSSHTIGPMKAGRDFIRLASSLPSDERAGVDRIEVRLFGSLSATGKGHGTDKGVLAGLLGYDPESCPHGFFDSLLTSDDASHTVQVGDASITVRSDDILFDKVLHDLPHTNTLTMRLYAGERVVCEREYYSVGGGFLTWDGFSAPDRGEPVYPYENMADIREHLEAGGLTFHELVLANETAITGRSEEEVYAGLRNIVEVMESAIERGLHAEGVLPGPIGLHRKAGALFAQSRSLHDGQDAFLTAVNAFAMAVAEESAAGHTVVTAPTCGASGVIPALVYAMKRFREIPEKKILDGLMVSAAVGFLAKHNASLAGADVGCQGEIGVASCMGAALLAHAHGCRFKVTENAAETAMEHHLGMTCDPVGGYVQIPCIERNAMGAVKAYNAYLIATAEISAYHLVDLDRVMRAMAETGRDMSTKYKETAEGGLAVSMVNC